MYVERAAGATPEPEPGERGVLFSKQLCDVSRLFIGYYFRLAFVFPGCSG
jgi:hypothetical protein